MNVCSKNYGTLVAAMRQLVDFSRPSASDKAFPRAVWLACWVFPRQTYRESNMVPTYGYPHY